METKYYYVPISVNDDITDALVWDEYTSYSSFEEADFAIWGDNDMRIIKITLEEVEKED